MLAVLAPALMAIGVGPEPVRAVLIPVVGRESGVAVFEIRTALVEVARNRIGLSLVSSDEELASGVSLGFSSVIAACGSDRACVASSVRATGATLGIWVTVDRATELLSVRLLDAVDVRIVRTESPAWPAVADAVAATIGTATAKLLSEAGFPKAAQLEVLLDPPGASLEVDGLPTDAARGPWHLRPGTHAVSVALEGYETVRIERLFLEGDRQRLTIRLQPRASLVENPWFWGLSAGVVVGAVVVGIVAGTTGGARCVCLTGPDTPCPPSCSH